MKAKILIFILGICIIGLFYWYFQIQGNTYSINLPHIDISPLTYTSSETNTADISKGIDTIELLRHSDRKNCWVAIRGNVYDVTPYLKDHPEDDFIVEGCGIDATRLFEKRISSSGSLGSDEAKKIVEDYYIGKLVKSSKL